MTENMKKFLELASQESDGFLEKLGKADQQELVALAAEKGVSLTDADFVRTESEGEVSLDEADAVAGGKKCACLYIGEGKGSGENDLRCSCGVTGSGDYTTTHDTLNRCICAMAGYGKSGN